MAYAVVPTGSGTTSDLEYTLSTGCDRALASTWVIKGGVGKVYYNESTGASADPASFNVTVPAGGIAMAAASVGAANTWTWTGFTKFADSIVEALYSRTAASYTTNNGVSTSVAVTLDRSAAGNTGAVNYVVWR